MLIKPTLILKMLGKWQQKFAHFRFRKRKNRFTADVSDLALMYIQSVGDSGQAFVNFIGLILIPYLCSKGKEKKTKRNKYSFSNIQHKRNYVIDSMF